MQNPISSPPKLQTPASRDLEKGRKPRTESTTGPEREATVDALRGLASLAVCWYHLTHGNVKFLGPGFLRLSGEYGFVGVPAFFVISGFILPWSLNSRRYTLRDLPTFILKRITRLDPPYLASIVLILLLAFISTMSPYYHGEQFAIDWRQAAYHLGYANTFLHKPWLNPVFWTLAIEFQYYLFIGLGFPMLVTGSDALRRAFFLTFLFIALPSKDPGTLLYWTPIFGMGISVFLFRARYIKKTELATNILLATAIMILKKEALFSCVGCLVSTLILFAKIRSRILMSLGTISYSLYLVHSPVGGRIVSFSTNFQRTEWLNWATAITGLAASLTAATAMYIFIERPSQALSSKIRYRKQRDPRARPNDKNRLATSH